MSSFRFEQHGSIGKLIFLGADEGEPGAEFGSTLRAAVRQAQASDIRVLLLTSTSGSYSLVDDLGAVAPQGPKGLEAFASDILASYRAIEELPVPTVAAVTGMALGGGFELLLAFDFLVAADSAMLMLPEVSVASLPLAGGVQRLAERVGRTRATRIVLFSEPIFGKEAVQLGVATHSAADAELESVANALVEDLANGPTISYGRARALLRAWSTGGVSAADVINTQLGLGLLNTKDGQEGMAAAVQAMASHQPIPKLKFSGQ